MTQLLQIKVNLSPNQQQNLASAFHKRKTIVLRLSKNALSGNDVLYVPQMLPKDCVITDNSIKEWISNCPRPI